MRTTADTDVYRAVADPSRRTLLNALLSGSKGFQELHALLPVTKGAVSQHLRVLTRVGLVEVDEEDRDRRYRLAPAPLHEIDKWHQRYRHFWEERLDVLGDVLAERRRDAGGSPR